MLKHVLPPMPNETAELPQFFYTVEKLYNMYQVADDLQSQLLIPMLNRQAKSFDSSNAGCRHGKVFEN